ncbi:MAG: NAD-dependent epimerase/dehydratase family protein [Chlamydiia bacterium]
MKRRLYTDQWIVITGGAGLLGSAVVDRLNRQKLSNIAIVDQFGSQPNWRYLVGQQFQELIRPDQLMSWLDGRDQQIEAIIHLGSLHETSRSSVDEIIQNNYRFSCDLAEYALKHEIRFVYTSCAQTYGDGSFGFSPSIELLPKLRPLSLTGFSHHLFDLWCYHQQVYDQFACCKVFDLLGARDLHKPEEYQTVRRLYRELMRDGVVNLYESPQPEIMPTEAMGRDFISAYDAAQMVCSFLRNDWMGIYNVGRGQVTTWEGLVEAIAAAAGKPARIKSVPMPESVTRRTQLVTCADLGNWKQQGVVPTSHSIQESVTQIIAEIQAQDQLREIPGDHHES